MVRTFSFSYNLALNLKTSFTGKDLLYTRLRAGNMDNVFGLTFWVCSLRSTASIPATTVIVNRLYYSFPVGDEFTVVGGPCVRQDDMLPVWPAPIRLTMTLRLLHLRRCAWCLQPGPRRWCWCSTATGSLEVTSGFHQLPNSTNGNDSDPNRAA